MRLQAGAKVGHYEILSPLGAGGMGEVYRARDTKLRREVALKILPASVLQDSDRLRRLEREAHVLAALNHPHVAAIYGIEDGTEIRALVLELVDGPTLADRLAGGRLAIDDVLIIARQVVNALDAAHEKGIVHRDLKPANIKITPDGTVKVLDFGLAKTLASDEATLDNSQPPTVTIRTQPGMLLGTPAYMSPEQARGEAADKRADIWAFGCVLYEMLAGRPAFARGTTTDTLAAVIEREPDWRALPPETSPAVQRLLRHCLTKDPKRRLRDVGDAVFMLDDPPAGATEVNVPRRGTMTKWASGVVAAVVVAGLIASYVWQVRSSVARVPASQVTRLTATLDAPDWFDLDRPTLAWSPDGSRLIYLERNDAGARLYVRPIDEFESHPIAGTELATTPFVAPDGNRIGFFGEGQLKIVSLAGGAPTVVSAVAAVPLGATWTSADTIVLGSMNNSGLWQVPASGGTPQPVRGSSNGAAAAWPTALPDGRSVVFTMMPAAGRPAYLAVVALSTGEVKVLTEGSAAHYMQPGYLVYMLGSSLMGVRFDPDLFETIGAPVQLLEDVQQAQGAGAAQVAVSSGGSLAYVSRVNRGAPRHLVLVNRLGQAEPIAPPARMYAYPRVSPDGRRIVVDAQEPTGRDVWVYDIPRASWSQLTFDGTSGVPIWTPDGQRITFVATINGGQKLYWKGADGRGSNELLSSEPGNPHSWAPDGRFLARTGGNRDSGGGSQVMLLSLDGARETRPFLSKPEGTEMAAPAISPDGHWIAYVANDSGRRHVYVRPFLEGDGRWLISDRGGTQPMWSRSGRELFYRDGDRMMAVNVTATPVFRADTPKLLFEGHFESPAVRANYDVMPDGQHFVMVKAAERESTNRQLNIVVNWSEELRRRLLGSAQP
jgi:serine/threonine-protein kinase